MLGKKVSLTCLYNLQYGTWKHICLPSKEAGVTNEQQAKLFHGKMLRGDVRGAVRYREKVGILLSDDIDKKTGDSIKEVVESKHPKVRMPDVIPS
jgi:hypothetical protein